MRRPNPTAYGHLVDVLSFKWLIYIQIGGHIYMFRSQNFLDPVYTCMFRRLRLISTALYVGRYVMTPYLTT